MKQKYFLFIIGLVFISLASASFNLSDYSVQKDYITNSDLISSLKISFENEPLDSLFTDSLGNSKTLEQVLNNSLSYSYDCSSHKCFSEYLDSNPQTSKTFSLEEDEEKLVGIILSGKIKNINSFSFSLESDIKPSTKNQFKIDILNDGIIETGNIKKGFALGVVNYGCFDELQSSLEIGFGYQPYCQKISLTETPGLQLTAWLKFQGIIANKVKMELYTKEGQFLKNCTLPTENLPPEGGDIFCEVDILINEPDEYYVCAKKEGGPTAYFTRGYTSSNNCGFQGLPPGVEGAAYKIGVKQKRFGSGEKITITDLLSNGEKISELIEEYIISRYEKNCTDGCYIPINILSFENDQEIILSDLSVSFETDYAAEMIETTFYDFKETPSKITSNLQWLNLNNLFNFGEEKDSINYSLEFNSEELFEEDLEINEIPITIAPERVIAGVSTNFTLNIEGDLDIFSSQWNFGDNSSINTTSPSVYHTYLKIKDYVINLTLMTNLGEIFISKNIQVNSAKETLTGSLEDTKAALENLQKELLKLSSLESKELKKIVDLTNFSFQLKLLEDETKNADSEDNYTKIYQSFSEVNFPKYFQKVPDQNLIYILESPSINLDILSSISGKNYSTSQNSYDYIKVWNKQNLNSKLSSTEFLIFFEDGTASRLNIFKFSIDPIGEISEDYYFISKKLEQVNFKDSTRFETSEDYEYLKLGNTKKTIVYSTSEFGLKDDFFFISPVYLQEDFKEIPIGPKGIDKTLILILAFVAIFLIFVIVYLVLHKWYQVKYEKHLFPNKNQLYNAITYVNNSLNSEMEKREIRENLIKSGWKREQVSYIMKKYAGKKIGMPGFSSKSSSKIK